MRKLRATSSPVHDLTSPAQSPVWTASRRSAVDARAGMSVTYANDKTTAAETALSSSHPHPSRHEGGTSA